MKPRLRSVHRLAATARQARGALAHRLAAPARQARGALTVLALVMWSLGAEPASAAGQRVTIRTEDGVSLAATWYEPGPRLAPAVILVHMLHKSRHDWEPVATRLADEGIG